MTKLTNYITLILTFLMVNSVIGQDAESKIKELINSELIDSEQAIEVKDILSKSEELTNAQIVNAIFQADFKKDMGVYYSENVYFDFKAEEITESEQKETNNLLFRISNKLKDVQLINNKQYKEQINNINNNKYLHKIEFFLDLINRQFFDEWMSFEKLNNYRKKLFENEIIDKKENNRLLSDINNHKITSPFQFIDYCKKARFFDLSKYTNDTLDYLKQIHEETAEVLPELNFSNFKFEIKTDSTNVFDNYVHRDVIVSLKCNDKTYRQKSFISLDNVGKNDDSLITIDEQEYYQIFNKILKDIESPYRLHLIKSIHNNGQENPYQHFGIVALKKNQLKMFRYYQSYWDLSYESFKNSLTTQKIDSAIKEYQKLGLLAHLNEEQFIKSIENIKEKENRNLNDVLISFPDVIFSLDWELGNLENPYEEIVSEYSKISHQEFHPINIKDDFDMGKESVFLSFDFANKTYETEFKVEGDWVDTRVFKYLNEVIAENNLKGQFYTLFGDGAELIYLTPEQYKYIRENKLLIFQDEWESQMDE